VTVITARVGADAFVRPASEASVLRPRIVPHLAGPRRTWRAAAWLTKAVRSFHAASLRFAQPTDEGVRGYTWFTSPATRP
jgi:hypothetical protein